MSSNNSLKIALTNLFIQYVNEKAQNHPLYPFYREYIAQIITNFVGYIVKDEDFLRNLYEVLKKHYEEQK
jgi:hypothetical protein